MFNLSKYKILTDIFVAFSIVAVIFSLLNLTNHQNNPISVRANSNLSSPYNGSFDAIVALPDKTLQAYGTLVVANKNEKYQDVQIYVNRQGEDASSFQSSYEKTITTSISRPDANNKYSLDSDYLSGWKYDINGKYCNGQDNTIEFYAKTEDTPYLYENGEYNFNRRDNRFYGSKKLGQSTFKCFKADQNLAVLNAQPLSKYNQTFLTGWAIDTTNRFEDVKVHFYRDLSSINAPANEFAEKYIGEAQTGLINNEIKNTYGVGINPGFEFLMPDQWCDGATRAISAFAYNPTAPSEFFGTIDVNCKRVINTYRSTILSADNGLVRGYSINTVYPLKEVSVDFYIDLKPAGNNSFNFDDAYVGSALNNIVDDSINQLNSLTFGTKSVFEFEIPERFCDGAVHTITGYDHNQFSISNPLTKTSSTQFTCNKASQADGGIDSVIKREDGYYIASGWAYDNDSVDQDTKVEIYIDTPFKTPQTPIVNTQTSYPRPEVNQAFGGDYTNSGWAVEVADNNCAGLHTLYVNIVDTQTGKSKPATNSPHSFSCSNDDLDFMFSIGNNQYKTTTTSTKNLNTLIETPYTLASQGDFNGDGVNDVISRDKNGDVTISFFNEANYLTGTKVIYEGMEEKWQVVSSGDIDNDGVDDLIWRDTVAGGVASWIMNRDGSPRIGSFISNFVPLDWSIVGFDDTTNNLYWRKMSGVSTGQLVAWNLDQDAKIVRGGFLLSGNTVSLGWKVLGAQDGNLFWRNSNDGSVVNWEIDQSALDVSVGYFTTTDQYDNTSNLLLIDEGFYQRNGDKINLFKFNKATRSLDLITQIAY